MDLLPLFLNLTGRTVVLVGGGPVATAKLRQLLAAGARVRVVAPEITDEIQGLASRAGVARPIQGRDRGAATSAPEALQRASPELDGSASERRRESPAPQPHVPSDPGHVTIARRRFVPADLDGAWLVVAAATPEVNRHVAEVAEPRHLFVNAVDDPANASAFLSGVVRRDGVTLAISTSGAAPALTALLRDGLDALLPPDLAAWMWQARAARAAWRRESVPMEARKPRLLQALNDLYRSPEGVGHGVAPVAPAPDVAPGCGATSDVAQGVSAPLEAAQGVPPLLAVNPTERRPGSPKPEAREGGSPAVPWLNGPEDSWL